MYRQQNSSSAVRPKPKITSNVSYHSGVTVTISIVSPPPQFAASLDKEALYMGRKRTALTPTTVTMVTAGSAVSGQCVTTCIHVHVLQWMEALTKSSIILADVHVHVHCMALTASYQLMYIV